ncbi:FAD-binding domain-containing protein [Aspergillus unguis]
MVLLPILALVTTAAASCRCFPGDHCWPSKETWNTFNDTIGGRLIETTPLGSQCHDPNYNAEICSRLRDEWTLPELHYASSSSIMAPFFANDTCDPFHPPRKICTLGNYVSYAVNVSQPDHVITSLDFVKKHNIRLVVRNTGHDYQGKSTGAGSLGLWMHHLKKIQVQQRFRSRFYNGPAITVGAGVQGFEALAAADEEGHQIVTGECPSVGIAGGYTQGGGHSALSSRYGLAADQVLAWEVIDGDGRHLVATPEENADLYWALSGGGGGTYAIVLSLTAKIHPQTPVSGLNLTVSREGISGDTFYQAISLFNKVQPALTDAGAMGISIFTNTTFMLSPLTGPDIPVDDLVNLLKPFTVGLDNLGIKYTLFSAQFPSYLSEFRGMQEIRPIDVGVAQYGGWLIPRSVVDSNNQRLTDAYRCIVEDGGTVINVGLNVSQKGKGSTKNAVLPAWRDALLHTTLTTPWEWNAPQRMLEMQRKMTEEYVPRLAELAPGSGAYMNEGDFRQPDFQQAFYGQNYGRLRRVKAKYDPDDIFYALTAVGSEEWSQKKDGRLCRVDREDNSLLSQ